MRVLITRPEPGATRTAERLRSLGHEPVLLPLTRTVGRQDGLLRLETREAGAFAATSGAAIRHWRETGIAQNRFGVPFYAVGTATGEAATQTGFNTVHPGSADAAALVSTIVADYRAGRLSLTRSRPLVYLAGATRKKAFEAGLGAASVPFETVEIYEIEEISHSTDYMMDTFVNASMDAVLFYSAMTASRFFDTMSGGKFNKTLNNLHYICMGHSVLAAIPEPFTARSAVAEQPDEPSLLALLDRIERDKI